MRIVPLAEATEVLPTLARLFVDEWEPYYGPGGPGDAAADLASCCNVDRLPVGLVALADDDTVLGSAALKVESVGGDTLPGPWLAAFVVDRAHRRRGVGTALIAAIEAAAARLGHATVYTSTDSADTMLRRRGWEPCGTTASLRGEIRLYRLGLEGRQP